jgi:hypothetical protein
MTEPPLTADPPPPLAATRYDPPLVGAMFAGIALVAAGLLISCVAFALLVPSGDTTSRGVGGEGLMMVLFMLSPWLYFALFNPFVLVAYAAVMILLGVAVLRRNRRSLVIAMWIVSIEAVPAVLLLPMYGVLGMLSVVPRGALAAILITTLRRQPAVRFVPPSPAPPEAEFGGAPAASRQPGSLSASLATAAATGLGLGITVVAGKFLVFDVMDFPVLGPLVWWWMSMRGPCAILAFALGWFAASPRAAVLRGAVAAGVCAALTLLGGSYGGSLGLPAVLIGLPVGGALLGWLGHQGRGHGMVHLLAALSLPVMLAVDQVLFPVAWTGSNAPDPGTPILLVADAALAIAFLMRFLRMQVASRWSEDT